MSRMELIHASCADQTVTGKYTKRENLHTTLRR